MGAESSSGYLSNNDKEGTLWVDNNATYNMGFGFVDGVLAKTY